MRTKRLFLYGLFIIIFLMLLAVGTLHVVATRLVNKERVVSALEDAFDRPVIIERIKFNIFSGITIYNIKILSKTNGPILLKAAEVKISYNLVELLERKEGENEKLALREIKFIAPDLDLSQLPPQGERPPPDKKVSLPRIIIEDGRLSFAQPSFFREGYIQTLEKVNFKLLPVFEDRYVIEGQAEAGVFGRWYITGKFNLAHQTLQLTALSKNINLGESFRDRLSEQVKRAWNRYQPQGQVALGVNINYQVHRAKPLDFNVIIDCQGTQMTYRPFPYPISNIQGQIELHETGLLLKDLQGHSGSAIVKIGGHSDGYDKNAGFKILLDMQDVKFDQRLYRACNKNIQNVWQGIDPKGLIDVKGEITRPTGPDKKVEYYLRLFCKKNQAKVKVFPYPLTGIQGELELKKDNSLVVALSAQREKVKIKINGVWESLKKDAGYQLKVEADDLELKDFALKEAFNHLVPGGGKLWDANQPAGPVNLRLDLNKPTGEKKPVKTDLDIICKGIDFKYSDTLYPFSGVTGELKYEATGNPNETPVLILKSLKARHKKSQFDIKGKMHFNDSMAGGDPFKKYDLNITATDVPIETATKNLLPDSLRDFFNEMDFAGSVDLKPLKLNKTLMKVANGLKKAEYQVEYDALVKLLDCSADPGISLENMNGDVRVKGVSQGEYSDSNAKGVFKLNNLKIADKLFEDVAITLTQEDNRFTFYKIKGTAYKGIASGWLTINLPDYNYNGSIDIRGVDIKELARDTFMVGKNISGKLAVELKDFEGLGKDPKTLKVDGGRIYITDAQLWEVPVFLSMWNTLSLVKKSVFEEGEIKFKIEDETVKIRRIKFTSDPVALKGSGELKFDGTIDLKLKPKFSSSFLGAINLIIPSIAIKGTFKDPETKKTE